MTEATQNSRPEQPSETLLYKHTKRNAWGLALLAWERDGRRAYQFEDGELRVFAPGFHSFMAPVDRPIDVAQPIVDGLMSKLAVNDADAARARKPRSARTEVLTVLDQIAWFRSEYAKGFIDLTWRSEVRGKDVSRRLKRYRDPAIVEARELLGAERLTDLMRRQQFGTIHTDVVKVLEGTDLVSPAQVKPISRLGAGAHQELARAVRDLLHGDGAKEPSLSHFIDRLTKLTGSLPSWQLATVLPALVHPEEHIAVRPATVREQAKSMAPHLHVENGPSAPAYERIVAMIRAVDERLRSEGLEPRDLMDAYDFMRLTLASKAKERALALRGQRAAADGADEAA